LGKPQGVGISEWETDGDQMGRDGDDEISLRATWDQGGRILSQQGGFIVSKGAKKGEQKGNQQGENEQGESATCILSLNVYIMIVCKYWNDCELYVCK
jgi:hypothetical protein